MTDAERIADIRARADAATDGPWYEDPKQPGIVRMPAVDEMAGFLAGIDAPFIAHSRADIPWLLERGEAKDARIAELGEALKACVAHGLDEGSSSQESGYSVAFETKQERIAGQVMDQARTVLASDGSPVTRVLELTRDHMNKPYGCLTCRGSGIVHTADVNTQEIVSEDDCEDCKPLRDALAALGGG